MSFSRRFLSGLAAITFAGSAMFGLSACGNTSTPEQVAVNSTAAPVAGSSSSDQVTIVPLTVPNTTFKAGDWGNGILLEASGFTPNQPITVTLTEDQGSGKPEPSDEYQTNADGSGNLSAVWVPSMVTVVPAPDGYPFYAVAAEQSGETNVPTVVTTDVKLTITN